MPAKEFVGKVTLVKWQTPTVVELRFIPSRKFKFEAGQFVSVLVPSSTGPGKPLRRPYSLALPPDEGWGLCVKIVPGGPGSNYIASLKVGDTFRAFAPYGDFLYDHTSGRAACFVSTGTGIAPFLSMIHSKEFRENPPPLATNLFGARTETEIIYPGRFSSMGLTEVNAVSQPGPDYSGFKGRVTNYLASLPADWGWHTTDFYLCGNGLMVGDVYRLLKMMRGVPEAHIHKEVYFVASDQRTKVRELIPKIVIPPPMKKAG